METNAWSESNSQTFIDYGHLFVPEREQQLDMICSLIPPEENKAFQVMELCCGTGLLAEAILQVHSTSVVHAYDGSPAMLEKTRQRLAPFPGRFTVSQFDLADTAWRQQPPSFRAVVSSLAIHHLDGPQKQALYSDILHLLEPAGVFIVADLVLPTSASGVALAAQAWDNAVCQRAQQVAAGQEAFDIFVEEKWNYYRYPDPFDKPSPLLDQLKWLEQAGFVNVDVHWLLGGHAIFSGQKLE